MEFNLQVCTNIQQSQKLLEIGLKRETADMVHLPHYNKDDVLENYFDPKILKGLMRKCVIENDEDFKDFVPAWSLNRLLDLYIPVGDPNMWSISNVNFDRLVEHIRFAIVNEDFPKEFLYENKEI